MKRRFYKGEKETREKKKTPSMEREVKEGTPIVHQHHLTKESRRWGIKRRIDIFCKEGGKIGPVKVLQKNRRKRGQKSFL